MQRIQDECQVTVNELNCGGGFGISYIESESPPDVSILLPKMITKFCNTVVMKGISFYLFKIKFFCTICWEYIMLR